ncbi:MAG TPA: hypothetical protein VFO38_06430 [Candidatus Saccharimonadales bacterium]|nr:hypothetical protein [Candidatus Saccharimonadales bacterium]
MFAIVRAFGKYDGVVFKRKASGGGPMQCYVDFVSFEAVTEAAKAAADYYEVTFAVAANGYRLGTHPAPNHPSVEVSATGDQVVFTTTNFDTAKAVWNDHAAGMAVWLEDYGRPEFHFGELFEVRVCGVRADLPKKGDAYKYLCCGSFGEAAEYSDTAEFFEVRTVMEANGYRMGSYAIGSGDQAVDVTATPMGLVVTGMDLASVQAAWTDHMAGYQQYVEQSKLVAREVTGMRISVFSNRPHTMLPFRQGSGHFGVFDGLTGLPEALIGEGSDDEFSYSIESPAPSNPFLLGMHILTKDAEEGSPNATLVATNAVFKVVSSSYAFALVVWNCYQVTMNGTHVEMSQEASRRLFELCRNTAILAEQADQQG